MKILFISHEASRTGAPYVLLQLIRWLSENTSYDISILLLKGGGLTSEFRKVGKVVVGRRPGHIERVFDSFNVHKFQKFGKVQNRNFDIIYANTVLSLESAIAIADSQKQPPRIVLHVHELKVIIDQFVPRFSDLAERVDRFITASQLVKGNILTYGIQEEKVNVVYEFSEASSTEFTQRESNSHFVIGSSGTVHWRKGNDFFIMLAGYMKNHHPERNVQFHWVGKIPESQRLIIEEDIRKLGLSEVVDFKGETDSPIDYFRNFDVFLMCSREDPFPLVCIEVGQMGIPIICFEGATGTQEALAEGGGKIVPYLDVKSSADAIVAYMDKPEMIVNDGQKAMQSFQRFTPDKICPEILSILKEVIVT